MNFPHKKTRRSGLLIKYQDYEFIEEVLLLIDCRKEISVFQR